MYFFCRIKKEESNHFIHTCQFKRRQQASASLKCWRGLYDSIIIVCCRCVPYLNKHISKYYDMPVSYCKESLSHAEMSVSLQLSEEFSTHELLEPDFFFFYGMLVSYWRVGVRGLTRSKTKHGELGTQFDWFSLWLLDFWRFPLILPLKCWNVFHEASFISSGSPKVRCCNSKCILLMQRKMIIPIVWSSVISAVRPINLKQAFAKMYCKTLPKATGAC